MKKPTYQDSPITSKEQDLLNRHEFAKRIARIILKRGGDECAAIGIQGRWGSGKTSLKNLVLEEVNLHKEDGKNVVEVMEFNPWLSGDKKDAGQEMFTQLAKVLTQKDKKYKELITAHAAGLGYVSTALYFVTDTTGGFRFIIEAIPSLIKVWKAIQSEKTLKEISDELRDKLKREKRNIVVIFDDIDRLTDNEIASLFRLIKSVSTLPGITFLLLYDREVVSTALDKIHDSRGDKYLEKIVQYPLQVPEAPTGTLLQLAAEEINRFTSITTFNLSQSDTRFQRVWRSSISYYLSEPRALSRFLNSLEFHIKGLTDTSLGSDIGILEVDPFDLISLECLRTFEPEVFSKIYPMKNKLIGESALFSSSSSAKELRESAKKAICEVEKIRSKEHAEALLDYLFPNVASLSQAIEQASQRLGINNHDAFGRYFHLSVEPRDLSFSDMSNLRQTVNNPTRFVSECKALKLKAKSGFFDSLLEGLSINLENVDSTVDSLASALDEANIDEDFTIGPSLPQNTVNSLIAASRRCEGPNKVHPTDVINSVLKCHGIRLTAATVELLQMKNDWDVPEETCDKLKHKACALFLDSAKIGTILKLPSASTLLNLWKKWNPTTFDAWIKDTISTKEGAMRIIDAFHATSTLNGVPQPSVQYDFIDSIVGAKKLHEALGSIDERDTISATCFAFISIAKRRFNTTDRN